VLRWVCLPTKHDGLGFRRLVAADPSGSAYGCWILTLTVAAKCPVRGELNDGKRDLTAEDVALMTGVQPEAMRRAWDALLDIGWLASDAAQPASQPHPARQAAPVAATRRSDPLPPLNTAQPADAPTAHATRVSGRSKKPIGSTDNPWALWLDVHDALHIARPLNQGPDLKAAKALAEVIPDSARLASVMRAFLLDSEPWVVKQGHALRLLPGRVNAYIRALDAHEKAEHAHRESAERASGVKAAWLALPEPVRLVEVALRLWHETSTAALAAGRKAEPTPKTAQELLTAWGAPAAKALAEHGFAASFEAMRGQKGIGDSWLQEMVGAARELAQVQQASATQ
jgi:hypothetical protein